MMSMLRRCVLHGSLDAVYRKRTVGEALRLRGARMPLACQMPRYSPPKRLSSTAGSHAGDRLAALPLLMEQAIDPIEVRVAGSERQAILDADSGYPEVIVWDHTACGT